MFSTLYDTTTTLTYPQSSEENFNDKIVMWMRQKMKRRGFAKFTTQLFIRGLIEEDLIVGLIKDVLVEVKLIAAQPKSEQTEENTTQYVDFLYETSKALPATSKDLKLIIRTELTSFLQIPRQDLPSLCMRSKFRVEDALKCVQ
jgi:hypothetical protein